VDGVQRTRCYPRDSCLSHYFPCAEDGAAIVLTYGPNRDWLKNITADGSAHMKTRGKTVMVVDPVVVLKATAAQSVKGHVEAGDRTASVRTGGAAEARLTACATWRLMSTTDGSTKPGALSD
jgi:hypothetical protein